MGDNDLPQPKDSELPLPPGKPLSDGLVAPPPLKAPLGDPNIYDPAAPAPQRPLGPGVQGPVPQHLAIAPGVLRGAAGKADDVYDTLHKQAASLEAPTSKAAKGVEGLAVQGALTRSHKHWEKQAGTVTAWLAYISESLRLAANTHVQQDQGTGSTFGQGKKSPFLLDRTAPPLDPSASSIWRYR
ncbi:WXG100 family type VII secretion target [Streptomyces cucumeris]|uniref:WXG100 family type VII secretion target n=1 Tax=Streptomyces cucumeris TaxID=2962890 RepID=UPI003EB9F3AF